MDPIQASLSRELNALAKQLEAVFTRLYELETENARLRAQVPPEAPDADSLSE